MTRYGTVRHLAIEDWLEHEALHRDLILKEATKGASRDGYTPPPDDPSAATATPYRWDPGQPDAPVMDCPIDVAEFIELRLGWADPEEDQ